MDEKGRKTPDVHFIATAGFLGEVARSEKFELPAFWFVVEKSGDPEALQVSHLQAAPASTILSQLVSKLVHTRAGFMCTNRQ
jgi:hypothetical protein